jgi:hypothetical protein
VVFKINNYAIPGQTLTDTVNIWTAHALVLICSIQGVELPACVSSFNLFEQDTLVQRVQNLDKLRQYDIQMCRRCVTDNRSLVRDTR